MVEKTALDRDFALIARWKIDNHFSPVNGNKFDVVESAMRQGMSARKQFQPAQHRPARRIDAIAANFFARKFLALDQDGSQSGSCAKCRAGRSGRTAADHRDIKKVHRHSVSREAGGDKAMLFLE